MLFHVAFLMSNSRYISPQINLIFTDFLAFQVPIRVNPWLVILFPLLPHQIESYGDPEGAKFHLSVGIRDRRLDFRQILV